MPSLLDLYRLQVRVKNKLFTMAVCPAFGKFGPKSVIRPPASIHGESRIEIGAGVYVGPDCWLQVLAGPSGEDNKAIIRIGDRTSFAGGVTMTAVVGLEIGADVLFGKNVHLSDHGHEFGDAGTPIARQGLSAAKPVKIGAGSWIGQGVVICPGVTIGRNSVIGANSVVRSDVPDFHVAAGVPARIIRKIGSI